MKRYLWIILITLFSHSLNLIASEFTGDVKFWTKSDFLGFDEVGDCSGSTGDITSVFARIEGNKLLLRISFDNMVERKSNVVVLYCCKRFAG